MEDELLQGSLEALYDRAPCGYLFTRPDGAIVRANRTLLDWLGRSADELVGARRFQDLLTLPGKLFYENQYAPLLRLQGFVNAVAFDLARAGGAPLPVLVTSVRQDDAAGRPALVASILLDATVSGVKTSSGTVVAVAQVTAAHIYPRLCPPSAMIALRAAASAAR